MALNIKNAEVERLAEEISRMAGETKTETVRRALEERRARLAFRIADGDRAGRLRRFLENEVWPKIPDGEKGRRMSRDEEDELLGYGPAGA